MESGKYADSSVCSLHEKDTISFSGSFSDDVCSSCKAAVQCITVTSVKEISPGCINIQTTAGSFFIRSEYLESFDSSTLCSGCVISGPQAADIADCSMTVVIERHAAMYIDRCEQCRAGLTLKLVRKGYPSLLIEKALDYLEVKNVLSDERFSRAWLNNRLITHKEGRMKLFAGLLTRGIERKTAENALDELFKHVSEDELLVKAYEKCCRIGVPAEKKEQRLIRAGFKQRNIKKLLS